MRHTKNLEKYAREGYNVILKGKHGVGKTAIIKEVFGNVFGEFDVKWKYYSASTMDPWVDFIGIPKTYTRPDGKEVFSIVPPEHFSGDEEIEALFFDEINRADEKVLNALMELIQFKSINGRKFPHLKCVWAAENPADDADYEYSVKPLDPAQKDRFQIQLEIPYELNKEYFRNKYGSTKADIAKEWWDGNKKNVSPRKLDDMLSGYLLGFDLKDFTMEGSGVNELQNALDSSSEIEEMENILNTGDEEKIKSFFTLDTLRINEKILKTKKYKHIPSEVYSHIEDEEIKQYMASRFNVEPKKKNLNLSDIKKQKLQNIRNKFKTLSPMTYPENFKEYVNQASDIFEKDEMFDIEYDYSGVKKDILPFPVPSNQINTHKLRDFLASLTDRGDDFNAVRNHFINMIMLIDRTKNQEKSTDESDMIVLVKKMANNKDFQKYMRLNKIQFNKFIDIACRPGREYISAKEVREKIY